MGPISKTDQAAIERLGEYAATLFGRAWDQADRRGAADAGDGRAHDHRARTFVDELRAKVAPLERKWIVDAKARGRQRRAGAQEFRAEVARLSSRPPRPRRAVCCADDARREAMPMSKIGFIGAGAMGAPMIGHLLDAGHEVAVHVRRREAAAC